jgi:hypothetical protein
MILTIKIKKNIILFSSLLLLPFFVGAQVKIGNDAININKNAILELETTNKGLLLPRIALTATNLATPLTDFVAGMAVYNTNTINDVSPGIYYCDGGKWIKQAGAILKSIIIASNGQNAFTTPAFIANMQNIKVYRNGANIEFTKIADNQIKLVLESANDTCFAGDEIKIIQTL